MIKHLAGIGFAAALITSTFSFQRGQELALVAPKRKLLYLTQSAGFRHDVIPFSTGIVKSIGGQQPPPVEVRPRGGKVLHRDVVVQGIRPEQ